MQKIALQLIEKTDANHLAKAFDPASASLRGFVHNLLAAQINLNLRRYDETKTFLHAARQTGKQFPVRMSHIYSALAGEDNQELASQILQELAEDEEYPLRLANVHCREPDKWLHHMNAHLSQNGLAPIALSENTRESVFSRLRGTNQARIEEGPLVSVVMSCHNCTRWVEQAVRSILDQTYRNLEIFAFDDCSTDDTNAILTRIAMEDHRLKVHRNKINSGTYINRNKALRIARGQYFTVQDADDWAHPQRIELQVKAMLANPHLVACAVASVRMKENGLVEINSSGNFINHSTMASYLFNTREIIGKVGYWDCLFAGADREYLERLATLGLRVSTVEKTLMLMLNRDGSLTTRTGLEARNGHASKARRSYIESYNRYHLTSKQLRMEFSSSRQFPAPAEMLVAKAVIDAAVSETPVREGDWH